MPKSIQTNLFAVKNNKPIVFYLLNGKEVKGILRGFEQYSITNKNEKGYLETYYKHVVSKVCWGQSKYFNKILGGKKQDKQAEENN